LLVAKKTQQSLSYYELQRQKRKTAERRANNSQLAVKRMAMLGVLFVVVLTALSLVAQFVFVVQANYEIGRASRELQNLQEQAQHLKIEIASLRSPDRLEKIALEEIGLQYPNHNQFIILTAAKLEVGD
jgi:cell division protein FtsL